MIGKKERKENIRVQVQKRRKKKGMNECKKGKKRKENKGERVKT